jgi:hypothetical protein
LGLENIYTNSNVDSTLVLYANCCRQLQRAHVFAVPKKVVIENVSVFMQKCHAHRCASVTGDVTEFKSNLIFTDFFSLFFLEYENLLYRVYFFIQNNTSYSVDY